MPTSGNVATLAHRYWHYALLLVAFGLVTGFIYVFNFTSLFGGGLQ